MTLVEKIDMIIEKIGSEKLSVLFLRATPIALELEDYETWLLLQFNSNTHSGEGAFFEILDDGVNKVFVSKGIPEKEQKTIKDMAYDKFIKSRKVNENNINPSSIKNIEVNIETFEKAFEAVKVPEGLNAVDLFFRSEISERKKIKIIGELQSTNAFYAKMESEFLHVMSVLRLTAMQRDARNAIIKNIYDSKDVFIIHGHDEAKRRELVDILKNLNLNPIVLSEKSSSGMTIIEKFEKYASTCSYAFALFTPDDIVVNGSGDGYFQARPNVIFELGWFYSHLGRSRVCILDQESPKSEIFSDLQGILRIQFFKNISEKYLEITRELESLKLLDK